MYDESSQARKRNEGATSFGWPGRFIGTFAPKLLTLAAEKVEGISGVQIGPGATPLTRMPFSTSAFANGRARVLAGAFLMRGLAPA